MQEDVYVVQPNGERFSMTFFALVFERTVNALCALVAIFVFGGSGYSAFEGHFSQRIDADVSDGGVE